MRHPLRPATSAVKSEKEQVAFSEAAQVVLHRYLDALFRLLAGIAIQLDAIEKKRQLGQARTIQRLGRIAAPKIRAAQEHPGRLFDALRRGLT